MQLGLHLDEIMNKVTRWRSVFAGWQLGSRPDNDGECRAVRDHREVTICLRVEVQALTTLLIEKGILSREEWTETLALEALRLDSTYERKFPGYKTTDVGVSMDVQEAHKTNVRLNFPP